MPSICDDLVGWSHSRRDCHFQIILAKCGAIDQILDVYVTILLSTATRAYMITIYMCVCVHLQIRCGLLM